MMARRNHTVKSAFVSLFFSFLMWLLLVVVLLLSSLFVFSSVSLDAFFSFARAKLKFKKGKQKKIKNTTSYCFPAKCASMPLKASAVKRCGWSFMNVCTKASQSEMTNVRL